MDSIIKGSCIGPIFKTEGFSLFIPWIHLQHIDFIPYERSSLIFIFTTHTVTISASSEILEYAFACCAKGELEKLIFNKDVKIIIEERIEVKSSV